VLHASTTNAARIEIRSFEVRWNKLISVLYHVILVLEGELITELRDGRRFTLAAGTSYQVGEGDGAHRSVRPKGARLFIVD